MIKQILPALIAGLCITAGGAAGFYLKGSSGASGEKAQDVAEKAHKESEADKHGGKKDAHGKSGKSAGKGGHGSADASAPAYYKFSREFVVPIIAEERVQSLVILNLNLQIDPSVSDELFSKDPVLRDNIMTTLIRLSNEDEIFNGLNNVENYETMRSMILRNLRDSVSEGIQNVLILDMARQDL
ncbi:hypothetical protein [Henriciella sp.]|uniref:hypothetical protein n=1 Tax=Henriciella sp. TaxID=1968823 RepID=UPI002616AB54|nr:hypothetical protein [Henriciella sp.]